MELLSCVVENATKVARFAAWYVYEHLEMIVSLYSGKVPHF